MMFSLSLDDPRIQAALADFRLRLLANYPEATFEVLIGDDPLGVFLMATVDSDDTFAVHDSIKDRLLEVQVDEELPVYVIPLSSGNPEADRRVSGSATAGTAIG